MKRSCEKGEGESPRAELVVTAFILVILAMLAPEDLRYGAEWRPSGTDVRIVLDQA